MLDDFESEAFRREFEWYIVNTVFSWKGTIQLVFMVLPPPGVARQGFVTSTIWHQICSRQDQTMFQSCAGTLPYQGTIQKGTLRYKVP